MAGIRVSIMQPEHLPWLGYLDKLAQVDVFVFLDTVQFKKHYFENRNRIRGAAGAQWVTVPVFTKGRHPQRLVDVQINAASPWQRKHWNSLRGAYGRAPHFPRYREFFEDLYERRSWTSLVPLNRHIIEWAAAQFGFTPEFRAASELGAEGRSTELLVELCRRVNASVYLSGVSGRDYLDEGRFRDAGIAVEYQEFRHPIYRQLHEPFEPCMAFVDLLMTYGPESARVLLGVEQPRLSAVFV